MIGLAIYLSSRTVAPLQNIPQRSVRKSSAKMVETSRKKVEKVALLPSVDSRAVERIATVKDCLNSISYHEGKLSVGRFDKLVGEAFGDAIDSDHKCEMIYIESRRCPNDWPVFCLPSKLPCKSTTSPTESFFHITIGISYKI